MTADEGGTVDHRVGAEPAGAPAATGPVRRLLRAVTGDATRLPVEEIAAVHNSGRDLHVDNRGGQVVAVVTRRRDLRLKGLTAREQEVATLVAAGYSNRQVALALSIRLSTVKDHVHAILSKSGFESRAQLIAAWYGGLAD